METEEIKVLIKALIDKNAIVAGGVLYCTSVMLKAAAALTAALEDSEESKVARLDDVPLRCEVVSGAIQFCVGEKVLAHAVNICPALYDDENDRGRYRVTNPTTFAAEVAHALNQEKEDGNTLLTDTMDKAVERAIEQGAEGVEEYAARRSHG